MSDRSYETGHEPPDRRELAQAFEKTRVIEGQCLRGPPCQKNDRGQHLERHFYRDTAKMIEVPGGHAEVEPGQADSPMEIRCCECVSCFAITASRLPSCFTY